MTPWCASLCHADVAQVTSLEARVSQLSSEYSTLQGQLELEKLERQAGLRNRPPDELAAAQQRIASDALEIAELRRRVVLEAAAVTAAEQQCEELQLAAAASHRAAKQAQQDAADARRHAEALRGEHEDAMFAATQERDRALEACRELTARLEDARLQLAIAQDAMYATMKRCVDDAAVPVSASDGMDAYVCGRCTGVGAADC